MSARRAAIIRLVLLACAFFLALYARRWEQLHAPQVWDEDGLFVLRDLINTGPSTVVDPINGYLVLVPRLISFAALSVSFTYYPLIGTLLAWAFIVAVACAVAYAPLAVRGGPLLALAAMFVPSDPEVYGLPLYTLWWAGLLVLLAALWRPGAGGTRWRVAFVIAGGLSAPVIVLALPLFAYRAFAIRERAERTVCAVAAVCAAVQIAVLVHAHIGADKSMLTVATLLVLLPKTFGNYAAGALARALPALQSPLLVVTALATLLLVVWALRTERREAPVLLALAYLWLGSMALSAARVNVSVLDPASSGPRYFFYPFVLEGWFFLHVAFSARLAKLRAAAVTVLVLGAVNAIPVLSRPHDDLHWKTNVAYCAQVPGAEGYGIPFQFDGRADSAWHLQLSGDQCRALVAKDAVLRLFPDALPTYPYVARPADVAHRMPSSLATAGAVVSNTWRGSDYEHSRFPGLVVIGSYRTSDADTGVLRLRLRRGDRIMFRTGPQPRHQHVVVEDAAGAGFIDALPRAAQWTELDFSSPRLPAQFTVVFRDEGTGWGEWSAVALAAPPQR